MLNGRYCDHRLIYTFIGKTRQRRSAAVLTLAIDLNSVLFHTVVQYKACEQSRILSSETTHISQTSLKKPCQGHFRTNGIPQYTRERRLSTLACSSTASMLMAARAKPSSEYNSTSQVDQLILIVVCQCCQPQFVVCPYTNTIQLP